MKIIKVQYWKDIPDNFTGIVEFSDGSKYWFKEFNIHREDGPAIEYPDEVNCWYLEDINYSKIDLKNFVILDYYQGKYGIMWYYLLDKDKVLEYPDIPGLITK